MHSISTSSDTHQIIAGLTSFDNSAHDLLCFSHLRWHFVFQRPQHLLTRSAKKDRVFFWEEPVFDGEVAGGSLEIIRESDGLCIVRPHLPPGSNAVELQGALLTEFVRTQKLRNFVRWYYTPMAWAFSKGLQAAVTVYDCMDELSAFLGAPPELREQERELLQHADVVFTGGMSLFEAKRKQHGNVHAFPSSIDVDHFRKVSPEPADQASIPHPRCGFYGVIDERFDSTLVKEVARLRPDLQFVFLGPVVKIDPALLPDGPNVHYLGPKAYEQLPAYLASWDVALLPFARNASTRYISPTKTPEYLAAGKPVVSTPIHDVVLGYGREGLVAIADTPETFAAAIDAALLPQTEAWRLAVEKKLAGSSWDRVWTGMRKEIVRLHPRSAASISPSQAAGRAAVSSGRLTPHRLESFDYVVAGAGFAGAVTAERLASVMGKRVLVVDKRNHIGGNTFDHHDASGILIHRYGPHIFHTNSVEVVQYLSQFTEWRNYEHRVLASVDGQLLPIPINLDTINRLYGRSLTPEGMKDFLAARAVVPPLIRTSEEIVVSRIGRELYEKFFRNYTRKQWGLDPSELDASVAGRIPVRFDHDDRYFTDTFQAMPKEGFTRMFERMLHHKNITVRTGVNFADVAKLYPSAKKVYSGPVDEFFGYRYGPLPYRSLEFKHESHHREWFQPAAVVNYPNDHDYTRVTEFKYLTGQVSDRTSVVFEYPRAEGDPYYPIPRPENTALYARYKVLAEATNDVYFVGRLATYRYYNMDQVVAQALSTFRKIFAAESATGGETPSSHALALVAQPGIISG